MNLTPLDSSSAIIYPPSSSSSLPQASLEQRVDAQVVKMEVDEPDTSYSLSRKITVGLSRLDNEVWNLPENSIFQAFKRMQSPAMNDLSQRREAIRDTICYLNSERRQLSTPIAQKVGLPNHNIRDIADYSVPQLAALHNAIVKRTLLRCLAAIFDKANLPMGRNFFIRLESQIDSLPMEDFISRIRSVTCKMHPLTWEEIKYEFNWIQPMDALIMREILFLADSCRVSIPVSEMEEYVSSAILEGRGFASANQLMIHEEGRKEILHLLAFQALIASSEASTNDGAQPGILKEVFAFMETRLMNFLPSDIASAIDVALNFDHDNSNTNKEAIVLKMLFEYAQRKNLVLSQDCLERCFERACHMKMSQTVRECYLCARAMGVPIPAATVGRALLHSSLMNDANTQTQIKQLIDEFQIPPSSMTGIRSIAQG